MTVSYVGTTLTIKRVHHRHTGFDKQTQSLHYLHLYVCSVRSSKLFQPSWSISLPVSHLQLTMWPLAGSKGVGVAFWVSVTSIAVDPSWQMTGEWCMEVAWQLAGGQPEVSRTLITGYDIFWCTLTIRWSVRWGWKERCGSIQIMRSDDWSKLPCWLMVWADVRSSTENSSVTYSLAIRINCSVERNIHHVVILNRSMRFHCSMVIARWYCCHYCCCCYFQYLM